MNRKSFTVQGTQKAKMDFVKKLGINPYNPNTELLVQVLDFPLVVAKGLYYAYLDQVPKIDFNLAKQWDDAVTYYQEMIKPDTKSTSTWNIIIHEPLLELDESNIRVKGIHPSIKDCIKKPTNKVEVELPEGYEQNKEVLNNKIRESVFGEYIPLFIKPIKTETPEERANKLGFKKGDNLFNTHPIDAKNTEYVGKALLFFFRSEKRLCVSTTRNNVGLLLEYLDNKVAIKVSTELDYEFIRTKSSRKFEKGFPAYGGDDILIQINDMDIKEGEEWTILSVDEYMKAIGEKSTFTYECGKLGYEGMPKHKVVNGGKIFKSSEEALKQVEINGKLVMPTSFKDRAEQFCDFDIKKTNEVTFENFRFIYEHRLYLKCSEGLRKGQFLFIELNNYNKRVAGLIRGTNLDPFNKETVSEDTWNFIRDNWSTPEKKQLTKGQKLTLYAEREAINHCFKFNMSNENKAVLIERLNEIDKLLF